MPIDVDKAGKTAAHIASEAAQAANDVAKMAEPTIKKMSAEVDDMARAATPYANKAEAAVKGVVDKVLGRGKSDAKDKKEKSGGGSHKF